MDIAAMTEKLKKMKYDKNSKSVAMDDEYEESPEDMKHDAGKGKDWEGSSKDEAGDLEIQIKMGKAQEGKGKSFSSDAIKKAREMMRR